MDADENEDIQMAVPSQSVNDGGDAEDNGVRIQIENSGHSAADLLSDNPS